jgi:uncharacterized protein YbaP (TraB family)
MYLGGTVHLLSEADYPLPESFANAYKSSQDVVLEADLSAATDLSFQIKSLETMTFQDHRSLSTVLDRKTYDTFAELLKTKGIPIAVFEKFTPAGATLALTAIEMQKMGMMDSLGVDKHFLQQAVADEKRTYFLETVDEQLGFIESMNTLDPNKLVQSSMKEIKNLDAQMESILKAWRQGDLEELESVGIIQMQTDFPSMYQVMLAQRNSAWMQDIEVFIASPEVEFMLVGALHMAGEDGLIAQLKSTGYIVEQQD